MSRVPLGLLDQQLLVDDRATRSAAERPRDLPGRWAAWRPGTGGRRSPPRPGRREPAGFPRPPPPGPPAKLVSCAGAAIVSRRDGRVVSAATESTATDVVSCAARPPGNRAPDQQGERRQPAGSRHSASLSPWFRRDRVTRRGRGFGAGVVFGAGVLLGGGVPFARPVSDPIPGIGAGPGAGWIGPASRLGRIRLLALGLGQLYGAVDPGIVRSGRWSGRAAGWQAQRAAAEAVTCPQPVGRSTPPPSSQRPCALGHRYAGVATESNRPAPSPRGGYRSGSDTASARPCHSSGVMLILAESACSSSSTF